MEFPKSADQFNPKDISGVIQTNGIIWFGDQTFSNFSLLLADPNMADVYIAYLPKAVTSCR